MARKNRSSWFVWFVVVFGLLSALALMLYGEFGDNTHSEWHKLANTLKQQGEPVYFAEVTPADVPTEQNFFMAEVFAGLAENSPSSLLLQHAATLRGGLDVAALLTEATQGNSASLESIANSLQRAGLVHAKTDYLLAGDRVRAGMRALGLDFTPLTEAADRPSSRFPVDYDQPFPKLPHLPYLEALGDWLAIHAMAQLSTGDSDSAALDLLLIWRLADSIASEPFLASQRTRRLLLSLFAGCIRAGIHWDAWTDDQLARFAETLGRARLLNDFGWALRGERAQLNTILDNAFKGRKPPASAELQAWLGADLARLDMRSLRARQVAVNQSIQHFLDTLSHFPLQPADFTAPPPTARERFKALDEDARLFFQVQTRLAQAATACALERHHLANPSALH